MLQLINKLTFLNKIIIINSALNSQKQELTSVVSFVSLWQRGKLGNTRESQISMLHVEKERSNFQFLFLYKFDL